MSLRLTILFEDNHCLAVAKPGGLLTQGVPAGITTLEGQVKDYLRETYGKKGRVYLGIPHRLDRPVSGVVLFARQTKSAQRLAEQFHNRQVSKVYLAAVEGEVQPEAGVWEDWLLKIGEQARSEKVAEGIAGARRALLRYRRLSVTSKGTLLELRPETGRMHQLRVQTSIRGWPIRGDERYGSKIPFGPNEGNPRDRLIALHAFSLTFLHPIRFEPLTVTAPIPEYWRELEISSKWFSDNQSKDDA
jgi:23S rRNA pseudouridine1911/1915/1917 synthase